MVLLRMRKKRRHIEIQSWTGTSFSGSPFHFSDHQTAIQRCASKHQITKKKLQK